MKKGESKKNSSASKLLTHASSMIVMLTLLLLPSPAQSSDVDSVCSDALNTGKTCSATSKDPNCSSQKQSYCQNAKDAEAAVHTQEILEAVWGAAAAVCTAACAAVLLDKTFAGGNGGRICQGANFAGGITDAAMTKQLGALMTSLLPGLVMGSAMSGKSPLSKDATVTKSADGKSTTVKDYSTCLTAATAGAQVYAKYAGAQSARNSMNDALSQARALTSTDTPIAQNKFTPDSGSGNTGAAPEAQNKGLGGASANGEAASAPSLASNTSLCSNAKAGGAGAIISCAMASDPNLPAFVNSPGFNDALKGATGGLDLPAFLAKSDGTTPAQNLAMGMGGILGSDQMASMAGALAQLDTHVDTDNGVTYAGGGSGGAQKSDSDSAPDFAAMMAGMMGQLNGSKPGEAPRGVYAVAFANKTREPASLAEDKTLNIFDRVSFRYAYVSKQVLSSSTGVQ